MEISSRKHRHVIVTPDLHLTDSTNWGNLGLVVKREKKWKFLHLNIYFGDLLESPRGGNSNK